VIASRLDELESLARAEAPLMLPLRTARRSAARGSLLRACVVQTVVPDDVDLVADPEFSLALNRRRHRNHLRSALAAVEKMLELRRTHLADDGRLDWLILPELSVHPDDVKSHLVPFARKHKAIVLAGLTYHRRAPGQPLVNSAIWIIPKWAGQHGWQTVTRLQGKAHLAPEEEQSLNAFSSLVAGFRPCQWLVGFDWQGQDGPEPLRLTAAVCYDATDLNLAAALTNLTDVFAVPALNKDVNTFDQMANALHYHMFQMVVVANNGKWGGSNAYAPFKDPYKRRIFHLHGQPQAAMAFLEIEDIPNFRARASTTATGFKSPPAGVIRP